MSRPRPILVTGCQRSGTTWVGRMLASAPRTGYIHEPLALDASSRGPCNIAPPFWYMHITRENEAPYLEPIRRALSFQYDVRAGVSGTRSLEGGYRLVRELAQFSLCRIRRSTAVFKDPSAILSAEWLAERFGMNVVILVRHPAAVANSLIRAGWGFDFRHLLQQPGLMNGLLAPFESAIWEHCRRAHDLLDQAALIWRIVHSVVLKYREQHADWIILRHEDLCKNPADGFAALFRRLDLTLSVRASGTINAHSRAGNPKERPPTGDPVQHILRDSVSLPSTWKQQMSQAAIDRLRSEVGEVAEPFYSDADWRVTRGPSEDGS